MAAGRHEGAGSARGVTATSRRRGGGVLGSIGATMAGRARVLDLDPEGGRGKWGVRGEWAVG